MVFIYPKNGVFLRQKNVPFGTFIYTLFSLNISVCAQARQAAPQRRTGALEPIRPRRPGVEPRHKLRTEINVVEGSAKFVYLSDLRSPWRRQY